MPAAKLPLLIAVLLMQAAAEKLSCRSWTSLAPRLPNSGGPSTTA